MDREIKFRAWHKKRKKYYEVVHLHCWLDEIWATCRGHNIITQQDRMIQIQPADCVIEQYTDYKDKNKKETYEEDILRLDWAEFGCEIPADFIGVVRYLEYGYFVDNPKLELAFPLFQELAIWENIGNSHENPELLED